MAQFRKRPVIIEAEQFFNGDHRRRGPLEDEAVCYCQDGSVRVGSTDGPWPHIHTLEGVMRIEEGDWIIKGVKGEFYPCKPDIFALTYERFG